MKQLTGTVKWWNDSKGYGFLEMARIDMGNGPQDSILVFAHYSAIRGEGFKTLADGETVLFDLVTGPKGPQAENIVRGQK